DGNFCMDALTYPDRTPHTGLLELKQVYRPVRVSKAENGGFIFSSMLEHINAGDMLDCRYEITDVDGVICGDSVNFSVEPMSSTEVSVPIPQTDGEAYIRFIFTSKQKTLFCEQGYEVCFDQIRLCEGAAEVRKSVPGEVDILDDPLSVTVSAGDVTYRFNKRISAFDSIKADGKEILDRPFEFNFFRAPVDNDVMKGDWYRAHLNDYTARNYGVTVTKTESGAEIALRESFGWSIHQPFAYMDVVYNISADGSLDIKCRAETSNKVTFLPRFGIRLFLPKAFRSVEYFGYGPHESYIDKHQASYMGRFTADISEMHEDYIRPQENSSHFGCKYMTVSDGETVLKFTAPERFSFSASEYTQEELAAKRHNFELEKCGSSIICVDSAMAGVGSNACGPALAEKYRLPLPEISAEYRIEFLSESDRE
ncbi:MAG: beta-galactosidase domain 4-containing protein, partial [Oscillospiraceae bacterium]